MGYCLLLIGLLWLFLVLSFAYIVYILANKESGWLKTTGRVFACVIAVLVLIVFLCGALGGGKMGCPMMGGGMMMGCKAGMMGKEMPCLKSDMSDKEKMECMMKKMGKGR
jgi:hypothetical protein